MKKNQQAQSDSQDPEKSHGLLNILKMIILVLMLVGAWFLLDWLISGK
jgi:flagellar basal body-associated protein FliL